LNGNIAQGGPGGSGTFTGGAGGAGLGGAIYNQGTLKIASSAFSHNSVQGGNGGRGSLGGGAGGAGKGGAFFNEAGTVVMISNKNTFTQNTARGGTGGYGLFVGGAAGQGVGEVEGNHNGHVFSIDQPPSTPSTTVVSTSHTPSVFGQAATFLAIVTRPEGTRTGTMTFKDGTTVLGREIVRNGVALLTTAALTAGTHSITAVYDSDVFADSSTSNVVTQTVNAAGTRTTLTSGQNPAPESATVTFTATVTSTVTGAAVNEGTVTFFIGRYAYTTVAVTSGVAKFATYISPPGKYSMVAVYNPGPNFTGSTSAVLTQVSTR
jgi:hypothetical protein